MRSERSRREREDGVQDEQTRGRERESKWKIERVIEEM